jgi:hypothetical protein
MASLGFVDVDPSTLRVPPSRPTGADPFKLHRQIGRFGASAAGMPVIWAYRGLDGELMIFNGVTRATRIAKYAPGVKVRVEIIGRIESDLRPSSHNRGFASMISAERKEILQYSSG